MWLSDTMYANIQQHQSTFLQKIKSFYYIIMKPLQATFPLAAAMMFNPTV